MITQSHYEKDFFVVVVVGFLPFFNSVSRQIKKKKQKEEKKNSSIIWDGCSLRAHSGNRNLFNTIFISN